MEISALTECELKRFSGAFRAGASSALACLPRARPFSLSPATSKRLLRRLRTLQLQVQNYGPGDEASTNAFNVKRFKKSVSTALWVYASLLVCYLPFMFSVAARMSLGFGATFLAIQWFTVSLLYMNSALNPVLYCWKIPEVRESVKEMTFCSCFSRGNT